MDFFIEAPIVGSAPHFYGGDPVYNLMIDGTYPSPEKHQIFMELEPQTGSPLRGGKKMQFNMFLKKIDQIGVYKFSVNVLCEKINYFSIFFSYHKSFYNARAVSNLMG